MKNLITLLLAIIPAVVFAQDPIMDNFPTKDSLIMYTEVVQVDSTMTADQLYINAKKWLADAFKSSKAVIDTDDKEAKLIIAKSYIEKGHIKFISNPKNWFILKIEMKDGRYRYSLYDIRYEFDVHAGAGVSSHIDMPLEQWMKPSDKPMSKNKRNKINTRLGNYCKELDAEFKDVITSLKSGMIKTEDEDW